MKILDNLLEDECDHWLSYCQKAATVQGHIFDPHKSQLWDRIKRMVPYPLKNTYLYRIDPMAKENPHIDRQQYSAIYYPANSDGGLGLYDLNWKLQTIVEVKRNRLVLFPCADHIHAQMPPTKGTRFSVVFKFKITKDRKGQL